MTLGDLKLGQCLRYGYGGYLWLGIILARGDSEKIKKGIVAGGPVIGPLIVFALGTAVYIIYRYTIGEWFLYPLSYELDRIFSTKNRRAGVSSNPTAISPVWYLHQLGVSWCEKSAAYTAVRRGFFEADTAAQLNMYHAEAHVVYLTGAISIASAFTNYYFVEITSSVSATTAASPYWVDWWFFGIGAVILLVAVVNDIRMHREALQYLKAELSNKKKDLPQFLRDRGFLG